MRSSNSLFAVLSTLAATGQAYIYDDTGIAPRDLPSQEPPAGAPVAAPVVAPVDPNTCPCLAYTPTVTVTAAAASFDPGHWKGHPGPGSVHTVYASGGSYVSLPTVTVTASYTTTTTIADPGSIYTHTVFGHQQHVDPFAPTVTVTATTVITRISHTAPAVTVTQYITTAGGETVEPTQTASSAWIDPGANFDHHQIQPASHSHRGWDHGSGWQVLPEATKAPFDPSKAPIDPSKAPFDPSNAPINPINAVNSIAPTPSAAPQDPDWHQRYTQSTWPSGWPSGWPTSLPVPSGVYSCASNGWCYDRESRPVTSLPHTLPFRPAVSGNAQDPGVCGISFATVTVSNVVTTTVHASADRTGHAGFRHGRLGGLSHHSEQGDWSHHSEQGDWSHHGFSTPTAASSSSTTTPAIWRRGTGGRRVGGPEVWSEDHHPLRHQDEEEDA